MSIIIPGLYGLDSATAWRTLTKDPQKYIDRFAKDKSVQKEIEYFNKKAPTFEKIEDILKDRRAAQFLLDSYGLGSEINNLGRIKKVLSEDPTDPKALVNRLVDPRFKNIATSLRLDQGMDKLQRLSFRDGMTESYIQNEFEEALGAQDNALRQAAYFSRNSNTISTVYGLLGDRILRDVVTSTFNLPAQIAIQPIETQAKLIASRVKIEKFSEMTGSTSVSAGEMARAKIDHSLIDTSLKVSNAALTQVKDLQAKIAQISTEYTNYSTVSNPSGTNAATIAVQTQAVPELIRFDQLLQAGNSAVDSISTTLGNLGNLIEEAKKSGSDINNLKAQFSSLVSSINSKISNANITAPDGSIQNILLNGTADEISVTYDANGGSVSINRYDMTELQDILSTAKDAFDAVANSGDTSNLFTAQGRILRTQDALAAVNTRIDTDIAEMAAMGQETFFAAPLNSEQLLKGKQSIDDNLSRVTNIETLLSNIGALATQSRTRSEGADRTDLETQFDAYRVELRSLIENTGMAGLDNFLTNDDVMSYEIIDGNMITTKAGIDMKTLIADVLDMQGLSNQTDAAELEIKAIQLTIQTDKSKAALLATKPTFDRVLSTYDPRGRIDSQIYALQAEIQTMISGAEVNGQNLLGADQKAIRVDGLSTGKSLSFAPQNSFKSDITLALADVISKLADGPAAVLAALDDTNEMVNRARRGLESDNRFAMMEFGRLSATIDTLDPENTLAESKTYKTNAFTEKFLARYLIQNGSNGMSNNAGSNFALSLFGQGQQTDLISLAISLRA